MTTEVQLFDITDLAIEKLKERYSGLTIAGIDDKDGYKAVKAARIVMKGYRVNVDKRRKELTEEALRHQQKINGEAKRIISKLSEIEDYLASQEKKIDDIQAEIEREKARVLAEKKQERIDLMVMHGYRYNGNIFSHVNDSEIKTIDQIMALEEDKFNALIVKRAQEEQEAEKKRLQLQAEQERKAAELQAEQQRHAAELAEMKREAEAELAAQRAKLAAEQAKLDEERELQRNREEAIQEAERLNAEKQREAEESEKARIQAIEIANRLKTGNATDHDLYIANEASKTNPEVFQKLKDSLNQNQSSDPAECNIPAIEDPAPLLTKPALKQFYVTLGGSFKALGTYYAESEEMAAEMAVEQLFNNPQMENLSLDFELGDSADVVEVKE